MGFFVVTEFLLTSASRDTSATAEPLVLQSLRERCYSSELIWGPFTDVEIDNLHSAVAFVNGFANG